MAFHLMLLYDFVQHYDCFAILFPHHQPKVTCSVWKWSLGQDILSIGFFHLVGKKKNCKKISKTLSINVYLCVIILFKGDIDLILISL